MASLTAGTTSRAGVSESSIELEDRLYRDAAFQNKLVCDARRVDLIYIGCELGNQDVLIVVC